MNKKVISILLAILLLILAVTGCSNNPVSKELSELKDEKAIAYADDLCKEYCTKKEIVGMSVAILKDGRVKYLNYGTNSVDGPEVTENTLYEIASVTKTFTGTLLANEVLKGKVALDDPVQNYLSYPFDGEYEGTIMTLKHLATHTSGLPRDREQVNWINPYEDYSMEVFDKFLQEFKLTKKPGTECAYSNLGFGLLGYILSNVENKAYEQLLEETITIPLDMKSTKITLDEELKKRKAAPYKLGSYEAKEWDFNAIVSCGGIKSTTRDLARYLAANMGQIKCDKQLKEAFSLAQQLHYEDAKRYGLAWEFSKPNSLSFYDHRGMAGGYRSYCAFDMESKTAVVILCNSGEASQLQKIGKQIIEKLEEK